MRTGIVSPAIVSTKNLYGVMLTHTMEGLPDFFSGSDLLHDCSVAKARKKKTMSRCIKNRDVSLDFAVNLSTARSLLQAEWGVSQNNH